MGPPQPPRLLYQPQNRPLQKDDPLPAESYAGLALSSLSRELKATSNGSKTIRSKRLLQATEMTKGTKKKEQSMSEPDNKNGEKTHM